MNQIKVNTPVELQTHKGKKEFKVGYHDVDENQIDTGHWYYLGLVADGSITAIAEEKKPYFKNDDENENIIILNKASGATNKAPDDKDKDAEKPVPIIDENEGVEKPEIKPKGKLNKAKKEG